MQDISSQVIEEEMNIELHLLLREAVRCVGLGDG